MATAALLLVGPASMAMADGGDESPASTHGRPDAAALPFSAVDFGWLMLAAAMLLVLSVGLQQLARRQRRARRSMARERTDP